MKKILLVMLLVAVMAAPLLAQNAFSDVPTDHWAYSAINKLGLDGYIEGYPDGTFRGKRVFTRYEMAMIVARVINYLEEIYGADPGVLKSDLGAYVKSSDLKDPNISGIATKADLEIITKLANELKAELTALGVDVNSLNADVNALKTRVAAVEEEQARVKITGELNLSGKVAFKNDDNPVDLDGNRIAKGTQGISFLKDFQLDIKGKVSNNVNAYLTLVAGDYLKKADDKLSSAMWKTDLSQTASMSVVPYYMYATADLEKYGDVALGRIPMQINKYVFKRYDNDSYTDIARMDNGDYQVDGIDYKVAFGPSIDLRAWLVEPQYNSWSDPTMYDYSLYGDVVTPYPYGYNTASKAMVGAQLGFNLWGARLEALYNVNKPHTNIDGFSETELGKNQTGGLSLNIPLGSFGFDAAWYQTKTQNLEKRYAWDNDRAQLWDLQATFAANGWTAGLGYKSVQAGYVVPGDWETMAWMHNPDNIKGFNANLGYAYGNFDIYANYKDYKAYETEIIDWASKIKGSLIENDKIKYFNVGAGYNTGSWGKFTAKYEELNAYGSKYDYLTISWLKSIGKANVKLGYQYINNKGTDQKGNMIFGQAGYSF